MPIKELKQFARESGLQFDAARQAAYGTVSGLGVTAAAHGQKEYLITISAEGADGTAQTLNTALNGLRQNNPSVIMASYCNHAASLGVKSVRGKDAENLSQVLREVVSACTSQGMHGCCVRCGAASAGPASVNGDLEYICEPCFGQLSQAGNAQIGPGRIVLGLIGALIGSLLGVALWVIIYNFGYIAGIAGLAMLLFSVKGYQLFTKDINTPAIIFCVVLSLLMVFVAENVCVIVEFNKFLQTYASTASITDIGLLPTLSMAWSDDEMRLAMLRDLGIGYFLYIIAGISYIRQLYAGAKGRREVVRLA